MSGGIVVVEDYESEDEGLDILFGDTTEIPPDRRKQITQEDVTIPELRRMIEEKGGVPLVSSSLPYLNPKVEEDSTDSEEEENDAQQLVYQGLSYIRFPLDELVTTEEGEMAGEWDPVNKQIINWEEGMFQKHVKKRGPWRRTRS